MRILVLGGSVFLSRAVATEAVRRGHAVTCANRGRSGPVPDGATFVPWDRTGPVPEVLREAAYDAVVDVARLPSWVRASVAALGGAHHVLVSTINVYADEATPGQRPGTGPLREPVHDDVDLAEQPDAYGPMKVACEEAVRDGAASWTVVRPGLVVGPGDPSGRFAYWPARLAEGGEVLAPGRPTDTTQVIDVRDLAAWIVTAAETRLPGDHDGVGDVLALDELLAEVAVGCGASDPDLTWVPQDFLTAQGVDPWAGPDAIPLWLPRPAYDGMTAHDPAPSYAAGLVVRPVAETARDTLAWLRATPDAPVSGIGRQREAELLAAWHARDGLG